MITGNSYLLSVDLTRDLSLRRGGSVVDTRAVDRAERKSGSDPACWRSAHTRAPRASALRPLPFGHLEPHALDDVVDSSTEYASRCLSSPSLETLYDLVIATAELRAGHAVVRDVLVALALVHSGCTLAELALHAGDEERDAVAHVLALLGNHIHRTGTRFRLSPLLRSAVMLRYPLGAVPAFDQAHDAVGARRAIRAAAMRATVHEAATREAATRDAAMREAATRDAATSEAATREAATREAATCEPASVAAQRAPIKRADRAGIEWAWRARA